jgi:solute carrier family 30 (zinc transporter), member 5/7
MSATFTMPVTSEAFAHGHAHSHSHSHAHTPGHSRKNRWAPSSLGRIPSDSLVNQAIPDASPRDEVIPHAHNDEFFHANGIASAPSLHIGHVHKHGEEKRKQSDAAYNPPAQAYHQPAIDNATWATKQILRVTERWPLIYGIVIDADSRRIFYFMLLNLAFMFVQATYGYLTGSLGLISDSLHMFFDVVGLFVGLCAAVMSKWPPSLKFPYG